ncbi:hypothetical protein C7S14_7569 [Burkholderia cepacia]|nr:hypothetical protein C7S14_7569 [Burkholderia cepacia]
MIGGLYSIQISTDESNYRTMEAAMPVAPEREIPGSIIHDRQAPESALRQG